MEFKLSDKAFIALLLVAVFVVSIFINKDIAAITAIPLMIKYLPDLIK